MLFNSWIFLVFLPVVFFIFYAVPYRFRWAILLISSYIFYGFDQWPFVFIILFSTLLDYFCSNAIYHSGSTKKKKRLLILSITANLGTLFLFKYFHFFIGHSHFYQGLIHGNETATNLTKFFKDALPVGISFYTFQTMSYTIDVYLGRAVPEKHLGKLALFVSFFPQLVAGPIERYTHLQPQLKNPQKYSLDLLKYGGRLILYGFFVKIVIADNLSYTVTSVFNEPSKWPFYWNLVGVFAFAFQIYADFFGYSLIAQGVAKLFGIDLMDNFRHPYSADGINDFWKKWHISLSTWFRDYLYIPLGGNRVAGKRWIFNISLVFLLSGLWHGANTTFIIWGALHAIYYFIEKYAPFKIGSSFWRKTITFLGVCLAWIFFRAADLKNALHVMKACIGMGDGERQLDTQPYILVLLISFLLMERMRKQIRFDQFCDSLAKPKRWALYFFIIFCILALSATEYQPFIYFRF